MAAICEAVSLSLENLQTHIREGDIVICNHGCCSKAYGLRIEIESTRKQLMNIWKVSDIWQDRAKKVAEYAEHTKECIRSFWEAGEPTQDGGYRTKFKGQWYQSKPVNEEPKCDCGLDEVLDWSL